MPSPIGKDISVEPNQVTLLGPYDIEIPPAFGTIKERYEQDKDAKGLIIHVQDLHTHYEAHTNIAGIVRYLNEKDNINVILCEAKETDRDFAYLRPWTTREAREKVAEENLKKGILTGWEALDLSSDINLVLQGIEDKSLYIKDMECFLKADIFRKDALKFTDLVGSIADNIKLHLYTGPQKAFDEKMKYYRDEKITVGEYAGYITDQGKKRGINFDECVNVKLLLDTLDQEKKIDFKTAEREREVAIEVLAKRFSESDMSALLDMSMKFKAGRVSQKEFYQYLAAAMKKAQINLKSYPDLDRYVAYIASYHSLDASRLFEEINGIENKLADVIFARAEQKKLFKISKNVMILRGLVDFKLTPDEFDYYAKTKAEFDMADWLSFLKLNSELYKLTQRVPDDGSIVTDNLQTLEEFYAIARKRDEAFINNIEREFAKRKIHTAFLMTGGFHTPGVTRRLKEAGYSYVVVAPRIEQEMDYDRYHQILKDSYNRLRETTVIGPWTPTELEGLMVTFMNEFIRLGAVRFAKAPEEIRLLDIYNSLGVELFNRKTGERTTLIRPGLEQNPPLLLQVLFGVAPVSAQQILSQIKQGERPPAPFPVRTPERRILSEGESIVSLIYVHEEGKVEVYVVDQATGEVKPETGRLLPPGAGGRVASGAKEVEEVVAPQPSREVSEVIPRNPVRAVLDTSAVARIRAHQDRRAIVGFIEQSGQNVSVPIDVDVFFGTSNIGEARELFMQHAEELTDHASYLAADILEMRRYAPDLMFYTLRGTPEIVEFFKKEIWEKLATVSNNRQLMRTEENIDKSEKRYTQTRSASISWVNRSTAIENPTMLFESGIPTIDGRGLNWYDWETAITGATILAPASAYAENLVKERGREGLMAQIRAELPDESKAFGKLATVLARLAKIDRSEVTAEMVAFLAYDYRDYTKMEQLQNYIDRLKAFSLLIRPIRPIDFDDIKHIYEIMKEVIRSI